MDNSKKRPILYKGEIYNSNIEKKRRMIPKEPVVSYDEARGRLLNNISVLENQIAATEKIKRLPTETIACIRLPEEFIDKSYYPDAIFNTNDYLEEIGSRRWIRNSASDTKTFDSGKLFFVRTTEVGIKNLQKKLQRAESSLPANFKLDIRKIESFDLLSDKEQLLGFDDRWESGRVEAILHPFNIDRALAIGHFKELISTVGVNVEEVRTKQYDANGLTFVSLPGNKELLLILANYNPLRTLHPIALRNLPVIPRSAMKAGAPKPPAFTRKSQIVVGVIDGGYVKGNAALDNYVEIEDAVSGKEVVAFAEHGTLVTSAVLYGALHDFKNTDTLPEPEISVKNFRVMSEETKDPDLYCVIDAIEQIVPANANIQSYNLSIGPVGPILDDHVSRFTYACDMLSSRYNVLFNVAVGNDGEINGLDRIQSPSDMVNGIGVAAHTIINGKIEHAPYSCKGLGREGNKMKPDVSALGGCDRSPIQLLSYSSNQRAFTNGTSFSAPQVSALSAKLIGGSKGVVNALTARLLIIHSANGNDDVAHCKNMGHGTITESADDIMSCIGNSYTLIYEGELERSKYREFEIPWVKELVKGKATFKWSVAVQTSVDPNSPDDYTSSSVEIGFYPNSDKYRFTSPDKKKAKDVDVVKDSLTAKSLLQSGWKKSSTPIPASSPKQYQPEGELRKDLKWDTFDIRETSKNVKSIKSPVFHVHALGRGKRHNGERVNFAIALTVNASDNSIDIYQKVRSVYDALLPISMEIQNQIQVK